MDNAAKRGRSARNLSTGASRGRGGRASVSSNSRGASATATPQPSPTMGAIRPSAPTMGGGLSGPSFTNDILNHLPPPKRQEMLNLVSRFRGKQISIQEFLGVSRTLLGEQLYAVLARGMSSAARPTTTGRPGPSMPNLGNGSNAAPTEDGESNANGGEDDSAGGFDVNKLDSTALQDVIQYSGVDLKAEAEMLMKGHDSFLSAVNVPTGKDPRMHFDYYMNGARLKALVTAAVVPKGITDMNEDCLDMISLAVQRRLVNIISELVDISKNRCEWGRSRFKIRIDNDPKKQLWLVDQYLAGENERVKSGQGGLGSADSLALARAKMKRTEKRAGEDVAVKTKLANVTAAVATGLQLKSWMTDPSALAAPQPQHDASQETGPTKIPLHFSQAPSMTPIADRDMQNMFASRCVAVKDLIYYAENDPHLRKSNLLLTLLQQ
ncbi:Transcription initiation factor TFIID component TAF4 domain-containing protein [Paramicrosporidium saccamoebae]|uniref:Transcription initiation factor TFIID subunit 4 n=1 Tax=Paramicrosporidium saccamoebae TaxID=1246581 RepID=A0A2H9THR5_9FUNG|nr:Transcription initiation factor TFIID component TAF4 domain-containing protein [Paramicrosporidium saccamoebae]